MKQKFKTMRKTIQFLIIFVLILSINVVAYSAIGMLISRYWRLDFTKGDIFEMELVQSDITGESVPGRGISVSPVVKNMRTKDAIVFIKVGMSVYGEAGAKGIGESVG